MSRTALIACWPWLLVILVAVLALRWLVALSGARLDLSRLRRLAQDEVGSVQSLSFVQIGRAHV